MAKANHLCCDQHWPRQSPWTSRPELHLAQQATPHVSLPMLSATEKPALHTQRMAAASCTVHCTAASPCSDVGCQPPPSNSPDIHSAGLKRPAAGDRCGAPADARRLGNQQAAAAVKVFKKWRCLWLRWLPYPLKIWGMLASGSLRAWSTSGAWRSTTLPKCTLSDHQPGGVLAIAAWTYIKPGQLSTELP